MPRDDGGNYNTTEVIWYRFTRLPFGLTCSPFLLSVSLRKLANMHKDSFLTAATLVDNSIFTHDFAARTDSNGAITIYYQLIAVMRKINIPVGKWASN